MQKGSIIEYRQRDGDTVFRVQYRDAKGRQVKESIGHKSEGWTKRKVQAALAERISNVANRNYVKPQAVLFRDYADRWLEESQLLFSWKPNTVTTYKTAVKRLKGRFGHKRLGEIERSDINTFAAELLETGGLAPRSVNLTLTVLHSILERAVEEEKLIQVNPARGVKRPKEPDYKPRFLSVDEARAIEAKIADPTVRLAFVTFELLGLRFFELRNLRWRDVDLFAGRLRVEDSKTPDGERSMSIPKPLLERLMQHVSTTPTTSSVTRRRARDSIQLVTGTP
jgi:integrase